MPSPLHTAQYHQLYHCSCATMEPPRRRNRSTVVCTFCKRRKIRCDKNVPCSSCVAHGNNSCEYEIPPPPPSRGTGLVNVSKLLNGVVAMAGNGIEFSGSVSPMQSEILSLRSKVEMLERTLQKTHQKLQHTPLWKYRTEEFMQAALCLNPCGHDSEFVSLQDSYVSFETMGSTTLRNYGPLSWVAMVKSDPALEPVIEYRRAEVHRNQNKRDGEPQGTVFAIEATRDAIVNEELDFMPLSQRARKTRFEKDKLAAYNRLARDLGFVVCTTDLLQESDLLEKIRLLIPEERAMWTYIRLFFSKVYPFFPFLDQDTFESMVRRLVVSQPGSAPQLKVEKQMDLIYLAQLLLVLRFGYLTLFPAIMSDRIQLDKEREYLLDNPIAMESIEVAKLCLQLFNFFRTCNLAVFQLLLLIKVYYTHGPEYGESPEDSNTQAFTSLLIKMGMSLGLHREPENLKVANGDKKLNNLRRKLWYCLLCLDYEGCITNGLPISLQKNHYDTETPHFMPGLENVRDPDLERVLTIHFFQINNCYELTSPVLEQLTAIRLPVALRAFCADLSSWEHKYFKTATVVLKYIEGPLTVENVYNSIEHMQLSQLFASSLYYLYIYYNKTGNIDISYFYLKKIVIGTIKNMTTIASRFMKYGDVWFSNTSHVVFVSVFLNLVQRGVVILHGISMRVRFSTLKCEKLPDHLIRLKVDAEYARYYHALKGLFDNAEACFGILMTCTNKLGRRYCTSWRCSKAHEILYHARRGEDYFVNYCKDVDGYLKLDTDMILDLSNVLGEIMAENGVAPEGDSRNGHTPAYVQNGGLLTNQQEDISEFLSIFWLQMHQMKGHADESVVEPFDVPFFDTFH